MMSVYDDAIFHYAIITLHYGVITLCCAIIMFHYDVIVLCDILLHYPNIITLCTDVIKLWKHNYITLGCHCVRLA